MDRFKMEWDVCMYNIKLPMYRASTNQWISGICRTSIPFSLATAKEQEHAGWMTADRAADRGRFYKLGLRGPWRSKGTSKNASVQMLCHAILALLAQIGVRPLYPSSEEPRRTMKVTHRVAREQISGPASFMALVLLVSSVPRLPAKCRYVVVAFSTSAAPTLKWEMEGAKNINDNG